MPDTRTGQPSPRRDAPVVSAPHPPPPRRSRETMRRVVPPVDVAAAPPGARESATSPAGAEAERARRRRRAQFLRELHEAKALRDRVQPRRARAARMRQALRMRTFRW
ncbi:hypothetical protein ACFV3R_01140 [Streptomyces sp. NPDC059740]|uniref:hypothetical protein n=1 Tax=Streptomyces sp. NPDC059740 TaxID=3346926 RepID=UPI003664672E